MEHESGFRSFVLNLWTEQVKSGDVTLAIEPVIAAILDDPDMTAKTVSYAVKQFRASYGNKLIRRQSVHGTTGDAVHSGAASRFVASVVDYGLALLDVAFGGKRLGDYTPIEALAYANQQHDNARRVAIRARFVAQVAKACGDADKSIRAQLTNEQVETIRRQVIESSPAKEAAEIALAVA